jgi:hypothetical protein
VLHEFSVLRWLAAKAATDKTATAKTATDEATSLKPQLLKL